MKLPRLFTTVTIFSKIFALTLFVFLPFIGFYFGVKYLKYQFQNNNTVVSRQSASNLITKIPARTDITSNKQAENIELNNEELISDPDLEKAWSTFDYYISKDEKWLVYSYELGRGPSISWLVNIETKKKVSIPPMYVFDGFQVTPDETSIVKEQPSNEDRLCDSESVIPVRKELKNLGKEYQNVLPQAKFEGEVESATWSKDNSKVVVAESRLGENGVLWIANGDGSNVKKIAKEDEIGQGYSGGGIYWSSPGGYRWSNDDKSVWVFGVLRERVASSGKETVNIFVYDVAFNKLNKYDLPGSIYNFSPDNTMAVLYPGDTFGSYKVKIVNILTKEVQIYTFKEKILTGPWSRNNKFVSINAVNTFGLISIDNGSTYLTFGTGAGTHQDEHYKWSCDSKRIYYQTRTQIRRLDIID